MKAFSIVESLQFGWHTMRAHSALVFQVVLTLLALEVARAIVQKVLAGTALGIGATRIALRLAQGHSAHYADIVPPMRLLWPYIAASLLAGLAVIGGLFLLFLPRGFLAGRLSVG